MNKKPVNIDEQRTEALAASLSSTGLDAFSISRFFKAAGRGRLGRADKNSAQAPPGPSGRNTQQTKITGFDRLYYL